jgi:hypothetical protein
VSPCCCGVCGELYYFLLARFDDAHRNVCDMKYLHWVMDPGWFREVCKIRTLQAGTGTHAGVMGTLFGLKVEVARDGGKPHLAGPWIPARTIFPQGPAGAWQFGFGLGQ